MEETVQSAPNSWVIPSKFRPLMVLGLYGAFVAFLLLDRVQATPGLFWAFAGSAIFFGLWLGWLFLRMKREGRELTIDFRPRMPHWIQMAIHGSIFIYWGLHWDAVYAYLPLVTGQIFFAYLLDLCLSWTQYRNFRLGFGPVPIVGSTNLFLWFKDPVFIAQFGMLAVSYLARQFVRWNKEDRQTHIFNPSAIGLSVAATIVIAGGWVHHTWGTEISITLGSGPYAYEQLFLAGAAVMIFFDVALMTMSAAVSMVVIGLVYYQITGVWFFVDTAIPIAVFLGMTLLLTDPVTSPRSDGGKVLFGVLYSASVMGLYIFLRELERPATGGDPGLSAAFFDKVLFVPVLNLGVMVINRVGRKIPVQRLVGSLKGYANRAVYLSVWAGAFFIMRPQLVDHPGKSLTFWQQACVDQKPWACDNVRRLQYGPCEGGDAAACHNLGVVYEFGEGGVEKDVELAAGLYHHACELNNEEGCSNLGALLLTASKGREAEARVLFKKACDLNSAGGCMRLGVMHMQGLGGAKDQKLARELLTKACEGEAAQACQLLGSMEITGQGGAQNKAAGEAHLKKGCELKFEPACAQLKGIRP